MEFRVLVYPDSDCYWPKRRHHICVLKWSLQNRGEQYVLRTESPQTEGGVHHGWNVKWPLGAHTFKLSAGSTAEEGWGSLPRQSLARWSGALGSGGLPALPTPSLSAASCLWTQWEASHFCHLRVPWCYCAFFPLPCRSTSSWTVKPSELFFPNVSSCQYYITARKEGTNPLWKSGRGRIRWGFRWGRGLPSATFGKCHKCGKQVTLNWILLSPSHTLKIAFKKIY